jgi:putative phosphotransacetylase
LEISMDQKKLEWQIRTEVLLAVARQTGKLYVPVGVSNRHIHLSRRDLDTLFGKGYQLKEFRTLSQPGQFAAAETVTVAGPKGELGKIRVLGPVRQRTQIEISLTDSFSLGIKAPVRMSGELDGTPGAVIKGPAGTVQVPEGVIVAARHLHISGREAAVYGLRDGDVVALKSGGERAVILENVRVRCGSGHELEVHVDTDEANAAGLVNGGILEIIR